MELITIIIWLVGMFLYEKNMLGFTLLVIGLSYLGTTVEILPRLDFGIVSLLLLWGGYFIAYKYVGKKSRSGDIEIDFDPQAGWGWIACPELGGFTGNIKGWLFCVGLLVAMKLWQALVLSV